MSSTSFSKSAAKISEHPSEQEQDKQLDLNTVWQHPFVDVFKHFSIIPKPDWKLNKKQGDVNEILATEIGRKAIYLNGTISANNYVQIPHPNSGIKTLGLTGRYLYIQVKTQSSSNPFSFHVDLKLEGRAQGIRISASNLYKNISTANNFSLHVPLNLDINRWTVVVLDIYELLKISGLLPQDYMIHNCYQIKQIMICSCSVVRGIYTSENLYDFVTLPPDMRFQFRFELNLWPENFAWIELPADYKSDANENELALQRIEQTKARAALISQNHYNGLSDRQKDNMDKEISQMLDSKRQQYLNAKDKYVQKESSQNKFQQLQDSLNLNSKHSHELLSPDQDTGFNSNQNSYNRKSTDQYSKVGGQSLEEKTGHYIGDTIKRSQKLILDPVAELKHVIGYSPNNCKSLKWSRQAGEHVVLFTSGGTIIAMDVETKKQKRFFFGHTSPVCCFDVSNNGKMVASAQNGELSTVRIWNYENAHCQSMFYIPVQQLKCLAFSPDGNLLACVGHSVNKVGKIIQNKEIIQIVDLSKIQNGEPPVLFVKHVSEFDIQCIKFSPIDNFVLVSCGFENIRFWQIKETQGSFIMRGSPVILNQHARGSMFTALDFDWSARAAVRFSQNQNDQFEQPLRKIYVSSKHGVVFEINYLDKELKNFFKVSESAINSISVSEQQCTTGDDDGELKFLNLDFCTLFGAKLEGRVCQSVISADGLRVAVGTYQGTIAIIDKANKLIHNLVFSHTDSILSMDINKEKNCIITASLDHTIRIFDLESHYQSVEFTSKDLELPLCVASHPNQAIFAGGFSSGIMRVFDIEKHRVVGEAQQLFQKSIQKIAYSPNGDLLVVCCEDGNISLHNAQRLHLQTKVINFEFAPKFVHIAFSPKKIKPVLKEFLQIYQENNSFYDDGLENENINLSNMMDDDDENENGSQELSQKQIQKPELLKLEYALFGIMGEYGNNLMIYDTDSIILKHQIHAGNVLKIFEFNKNSTEVILITVDLKIRFYALTTSEGQFIKELSTAHRGSVNTADLSLNGGYMVTGGDDNLIKIWDYDAQKTVPYYYQAYIGHIYPITDVIFNPSNNNQILSIADKDGIYIWDFHGDTSTNYFGDSENYDQHYDEDELIEKLIISKKMLHQPTMLETMRASVKDKKNPKLALYSFQLDEFKPCKLVQDGDQKSLKLNKPDYDPQGNSQLKQFYDQQSKLHQLPYNHFYSFKEQNELKVEPELEQFNPTVLPKIVNGYDGFAGVHDNLIWNPNTGTIFYTLNNKVIKENTKDRSQTIFADSTVRLSCLAQNFDHKKVAAAEGEQNTQGYANIYIYVLEHGKDKEKENRFKLDYILQADNAHRKGVQSMEFVNGGSMMISLSVFEEKLIVGWDLSTRNVVFLIPLHEESLNIHKIIISKPYKEQTEDQNFDFLSFGAKTQLLVWEVDLSNETQKPREVPIDYEQPINPNIDFITGYHYHNEDLNHQQFITGTNDGKVLVFDMINGEFEQYIYQVSQGQIGQISVRTNVPKKEQKLKKNQELETESSAVVATSTGEVMRYKFQNNQIPSFSDLNRTQRIDIGSAITSLVMDEQNIEGILGTSCGEIYYINLQENLENDHDHDNDSKKIKLVNRCCPTMDEISTVFIDSSNQNVFLSTCGNNSGDLRLYTTGTIDQVFHFPEYQLSPIRFVIGNKKKHRWVGHEDGKIRMILLESLDVRDFYQMDLKEDEKITTATYNSNGSNFAIGTNFGNVYLCNYASKLITNRANPTFNLTYLQGLNLAEEYGVASISLSNLFQIVSGQQNEFFAILVVAFDNGQIRTWEARQNTEKKKNDKKMLDIADQKGMIFNMKDDWNIVTNDEVTLQNISVNDLDQQNSIHGQRVKCEVMLAPTITTSSSSSQPNYYFCFVSTSMSVFLRSWTDKRILKTIDLKSYPTCMHVIRFETDTYKDKIIGDQNLLAVGTQAGKCIVYRINQKDDHLIFSTRNPHVFGSVSGVCMTENTKDPKNQTLIVSSNSGELLNFDLFQPIKEHFEKTEKVAQKGKGRR